MLKRIIGTERRNSDVFCTQSVKRVGQVFVLNLGKRVNKICDKYCRRYVPCYCNSWRVTGEPNDLGGDFNACRFACIEMPAVGV